MQFAVPVLAQVPATALHLGGLDAYNRTACNSANRNSRLAFLRAEYGKTLAARMVRGLAPYFLAAVVNQELKRALGDASVEGRHEEKATAQHGHHSEQLLAVQSERFLK
jgi:hypothetical protein